MNERLIRKSVDEFKMELEERFILNEGLIDSYTDITTLVDWDQLCLQLDKALEAALAAPSDA
jgi:hypothetical protein